MLTCTRTQSRRALTHIWANISYVSTEADRQQGRETPRCEISFMVDLMMWREAVCDEWGGAESRGNGARPVELMMMSNTCTTHRSRVPRRSSGRIKGGATTVQDERGPGLDFNLCFVCGSRPWGAAALLLCLFILLKSFECSPVPASFFPFYELCYTVELIGHVIKITVSTCIWVFLQL